jgi:predicted Zn finger-like uncharacterized protein
MDVRCERCRAQYVFDDDQVTAAGLTVQCTNCGHLFKVKKKELVVTVPVSPDDVTGTPLPITAAAPRPGGTQAGMPAAGAPSRPSSPGLPAVAAPSPSEAPQREWRVRQANGNIFTFRELTTLQKWIVEQKVGRDDEISLSGEQWKRLGNIAELASFFQVVEAAERSRSQVALPALSPLAGMTPAPMPAYGVAVQTPLHPPPPPSGFPPPAFTTPPAERPAPVAAQAEAPPPVHDVDVSFEDEAPPRRKGGTRVVLVVAALLVLAGGAAALVVPRLLEKPAPVPVAVAPPPAPAAAPEPPKPTPPPEPPPPPAPAVAPVPAPEAVVQEGVPPPPAPITRPAPAAKGPKALLARARALLAKGDADAALELYGRVASDDPGNVEAQAGRGLCYLDLENWAPAEASFQAALRLEPDHADAMLGLAETYRFEGKKTEAIPAYERYLARYPDGEEAQVAKNALAELRK